MTSTTLHFFLLLFCPFFLRLLHISAIFCWLQIWINNPDIFWNFSLIYLNYHQLHLLVCLTSSETHISKIECTISVLYLTNPKQPVLLSSLPFFIMNENSIPPGAQARPWDDITNSPSSRLTISNQTLDPIHLIFCSLEFINFSLFYNPVWFRPKCLPYFTWPFLSRHWFISSALSIYHDSFVVRSVSWRRSYLYFPNFGRFPCRLLQVLFLYWNFFPHISARQTTDTLFRSEIRYLFQRILCLSLFVS